MSPALNAKKSLFGEFSFFLEILLQLVYTSVIYSTSTEHMCISNILLSCQLSFGPLIDVNYIYMYALFFFFPAAAQFIYSKRDRHSSFTEPLEEEEEEEHDDELEKQKASNIALSSLDQGTVITESLSYYTFIRSPYFTYLQNVN